METDLHISIIRNFFPLPRPLSLISQLSLRILSSPQSQIYFHFQDKHESRRPRLLSGPWAGFVVISEFLTFPAQPCKSGDNMHFCLFYCRCWSAWGSCSPGQSLLVSMSAEPGEGRYARACHNVLLVLLGSYCLSVPTSSHEWIQSPEWSGEEKTQEVRVPWAFLQKPLRFLWLPLFSDQPWHLDPPHIAGKTLGYLSMAKYRLIQPGQLKLSHMRTKGHSTKPQMSLRIWRLQPKGGGVLQWREIFAGMACWKFPSVFDCKLACSTSVLPPKDLVFLPTSQRTRV